MSDRTHSLRRAILARVACYRALATARSDSIDRLARIRVRRLLVVCHGNIYRSAFVGAFFANHPVHGLQVRSAGVHPAAGRPAPERHVEMCRKVGIELGNHRSSILALEDLAWADLIVVMDRHNWLSVIERGGARERIVWLGGLDGGAVEIADPYGLDDGAAKRIVDRLLSCCERLAAGLTGYAGQPGRRP